MPSIRLCANAARLQYDNIVHNAPSTSLRLLGVLPIRRRRRASYLAHSDRYYATKIIKPCGNTLPARFFCGCKFYANFIRMFKIMFCILWQLWYNICCIIIFMEVNLPASAEDGASDSFGLSYNTVQCCCCFIFSCLERLFRSLGVFHRKGASFSFGCSAQGR